MNVAIESVYCGFVCVSERETGRERFYYRLSKAKYCLLTPKILHFTWCVWKWVVILDVQELYQWMLQSRVYIVILCVWERGRHRDGDFIIVFLRPKIAYWDETLSRNTTLLCIRFFDISKEVFVFGARLLALDARPRTHRLEVWYPFTSSSWSLLLLLRWWSWYSTSLSSYSSLRHQGEVWQVETPVVWREDGVARELYPDSRHHSR